MNANRALASPYSDLARKHDIVDNSFVYRNGKPLFSVVELNVTNICTRHCEFCPVSYPEYIAPPGIMSSEVFDNLSSILHEINFQGMLLFSGFCEPLLYKQLLDAISNMRNAAPYCHIEVNTNGDLLTPQLAKDIFKAGASTISISVYDGIEAMEKFENFRIDNCFNDLQIVLRRRFYDKNDYGFLFSNRTGCIESKKYSTRQEEFPLQRSCYYPFYYIFVDTDGSVLSCPHDWFRKGRVGNVLIKSLVDVWLDVPLMELRRHLLHKDRSALPCSKCNTDGMLMGQKYVDAWSAVCAFPDASYRD